MIQKRGRHLRAPECDCVIDLIEAILKTAKVHEDHGAILQHVNETVSSLESLSEERLYLGSKKKLFDLIDSCAAMRPEASVMRLIDYRANGIYPARTGNRTFSTSLPRWSLQ